MKVGRKVRLHFMEAYLMEINYCEYFIDVEAKNYFKQFVRICRNSVDCVVMVRSYIYMPMPNDWQYFIILPLINKRDCLQFMQIIL